MNALPRRSGRTMRRGAVTPTGDLISIGQLVVNVPIKQESSP